jgi:hypothetical protein
MSVLWLAAGSWTMVVRTTSPCVAGQLSATLGGASGLLTWATEIVLSETIADVSSATKISRTRPFFPKSLPCTPALIQRF